MSDKLSVYSQPNSTIVAIFETNVLGVIDISVSNVDIKKLGSDLIALATNETNLEISLYDLSAEVNTEVWIVPSTNCFDNSYIVSNSAQVIADFHFSDQKEEICIFLPSKSGIKTLEYEFIAGKGNALVYDKMKLLNTKESTQKFENLDNTSALIRYTNKESSHLRIRKTNIQESVFIECQAKKINQLTSISGINSVPNKNIRISHSCSGFYLPSLFGDSSIGYITSFILLILLPTLIVLSIAVILFNKNCPVRKATSQPIETGLKDIESNLIIDVEDVLEESENEEN